MLMIAARRRQRKANTHRIMSVRRSYRMANQIKLPKHRLYIGHAIVGIQVARSKTDTAEMQIVVFHLPRGANRSERSDRQAVSKPKTRVM
jgi:hypothetical protein